jgi:hypothetical protein
MVGLRGLCANVEAGVVLRGIQRIIRRSNDKITGRIIPYTTETKGKEEAVISTLALVGTARVNGYTVTNYAPVMSDEERKKTIRDTTVKLLSEYNRMEEAKPSVGER